MSGNNEPTPSPAPEPTPTPSPSPTPDPSPTPTPAPEPGALTDQKPEPTPEPEPFVPLTPEDLTFAEGVEVNEELRDDFLKIVNDQEMSPKDRANALVGLQERAAQAAAEASSQAWEALNTQWQDAVKADPEVGGANLDATLGRIGKLIDEHAPAPDKLREALNVTGAGNNPEVVKFLNKVATLLSEGTPISGQPTNQEQSAAAVLFPSMQSKG